MEIEIPDIVYEGIANDIVNELALTAPVDKGHLKNSIRAYVKDGEIIIEMVDYAKYVEFGTPPHIIRPKNKKALAWGKTVGRKEDGTAMKENVAKEVHHPGTMPQPFIRNAFLTKLIPIVKRNLERHVFNVKL